MTQHVDPDTTDLQTIIQNERILSRRLLWLLILPFVVTVAVVAMFIMLNRRLAEVETGTRIVTIERYYNQDKNLERAIDQYEELAKTRPSALVLARLGELYLFHGQRDLAIKTLDQAKALDSNVSEIYRMLAYIHLVSDRYQEALDAGQIALKLNPSDAGTLNNLAWLRAKASNPKFINLEEAERYAHQAVTLTKEQNCDYLDTLAVVYFQQGKRDLARDAVRKARNVIADPGAKMRNLKNRFRELFPNDEAGLRELFPDNVL